MAGIEHGAWVDGRLLALDLETTAKEPDDALVVTAAAVLAGAEAETVMRDWMVAVEVPEEAAAIHGVTTEVAMRDGRPPAEVIAALLDWLEECIRRWGCPLIIFNGRYDLTVLDREARRYELVPLQDRLGPLLRVIDPLIIDKHLHRYRKGSRKLDAMCAHYGAKLDEAHEAYSDALSAARLAWALGHCGSVIRSPRSGAEQDELRELEAEWAEARLDLDKLHAAQERWARVQAESLQEYFDGLPLTDEYPTRRHVAREWPVVPEGVPV